MQSAFGVDHGEFSKGYYKDMRDEKHATHGRLAAGALLPGYHGAVAGKRGKKLRAAGSEVGGAFLGSAVPGPGTVVGGAVGTQYAAKHGYYKPQKGGM